MSSQTIELCRPEATQGFSVHKLVANCPPLDTNSMYCNLLQCSHFAGTSVVAMLDGELVGSISGYLIPERPDTLFIWQVAVGDKARGEGLATRMLAHLLERPACRQVAYMETTITEANQASWALFTRFAERRGAPTQKTIQFDRDRHFGGEHDSEMLLRIGPF
ncbi:diaminobutyrate acetyltransferase [Motiliproteus sp. SC1-56]|uniref:diaminobutyrate acetyltransferase n=1 Tax=Motiliproteus sp. SC1-56 TaxID=2799565 RepID=UPI001A8FD8B5|nr:diaminobutyrate acetyltransferase [Motiliproteus sp. SC1-56]